MNEDGIAGPVEFEIIDERGAHRWFNAKCENCGRFIDEVWGTTEKWGETVWSCGFGKPDEHYKYCPCCGCELDWSILQET